MRSLRYLIHFYFMTYFYGPTSIVVFGVEYRVSFHSRYNDRHRSVKVRHEIKYA